MTSLTHLSKAAQLVRLGLLLLTHLVLRADPASIEPLGVLSGYTDSLAAAISDDGGTVVGNSVASLRSRAFVWRPGSGMVALPVHSEDMVYTWAAGISGDGQKIIGHGSYEDDRDAALLWVTNQPSLLPTFFDSPRSTKAYAISKDGRSIVGVDNYEALLWKDARAPIRLPFGYGVELQPSGVAISADGGVVVARYGPFGDNLPLRWKASSNTWQPIRINRWAYEG